MAAYLTYRTAGRPLIVKCAAVGGMVDMVPFLCPCSFVVIKHDGSVILQISLGVLGDSLMKDERGLSVEIVTSTAGWDVVAVK